MFASSMGPTPIKLYVIELGVGGGKQASCLVG